MKPFASCRAPKKATVRFTPQPHRQPASLTARIDAARLTALGFRRLSEQAGAGSEYRERMLALAGVWDKKADKLTRLARGKQMQFSATLP